MIVNAPNHQDVIDTLRRQYAHYSYKLYQDMQYGIRSDCNLAVLTKLSDMLTNVLNLKSHRDMVKITESMYQVLNISESDITGSQNANILPTLTQVYVQSGNNSSGTNDHQSLSNLQGGSPYIHLDQAEYNDLTDNITDGGTI